MCYIILSNDMIYETKYFIFWIDFSYITQKRVKIKPKLK